MERYYYRGLAKRLPALTSVCTAMPGFLLILTAGFVCIVFLLVVKNRCEKRAPAETRRRTEFIISGKRDICVT